ncbi:MAG: hypothetical protein KDD70_16780, partial [Bdellovibrionales bacterium]|nr:hypothetical protein [Bdellovibrionales bacterium]
LRYLRDIRVIPIDRGQIVDIVIEVQDTWTIIPQFSFSSGDGRTRKSAGFSEGNLFGYGNRAEILYQEDTGADTVQAAFDSRRLWNSQYQGQLALETGSTGDQVFYDVGDPFRSLAQQQAWSQSSLFSDTIERLYDAAEERFVFRKETNKLGGSYAFALGDPSEEVRRFSMGLSYLSEKFDSANASDLEDVNVDPADLPENGGKLAEDRKFVGPQIGYQYIEQDFVRRNYVDRFSRIQDFNLGSKFQSSVQFAPDFLGSNEDTLLLNTSFGEGYRLANKSFLRWEFEADTRLITQGFENSILSAEAQYIYPIGMLEWGRWFLGNHTFVARTLLDYSEDLDDDVEFLVGGDNMIRGYDARTFTGDKRFALNMEDRIHLVDNIYEFFSLGLAVFADVAGSTRDPLGTLYTNHLYSDVGVGLRIGFPRSNGERVVRIDFAAPLRDGPDGSGALELRILFAGGQLYGARLGTERRAANRVGVDLGF